MTHLSINLSLCILLIMHQVIKTYFCIHLGSFGYKAIARNVLQNNCHGILIEKKKKLYISLDRQLYVDFTVEQLRHVKRPLRGKLTVFVCLFFCLCADSIISNHQEAHQSSCHQVNHE